MGRAALYWRQLSIAKWKRGTQLKGTKQDLDLVLIQNSLVPASMDLLRRERACCYLPLHPPIHYSIQTHCYFLTLLNLLSESASSIGLVQFLYRGENHEKTFSVTKWKGEKRQSKVAKWESHSFTSPRQPGETYREQKKYLFSSEIVRLCGTSKRMKNRICLFIKTNLLTSLVSCSFTVCLSRRAGTFLAKQYRMN